MPEAAVAVRDLVSDDLDAILVMERLCFTIPWTRGMFDEELANERAQYLVATVDGTVAGYAGSWWIFDEGHITNVAVHPDQRRRGVGAALIRALLECGRIAGVRSFTLEVRRGNEAAIGLYESFGFHVDGVRRGYYEDTGEDALIMWLHPDPVRH